MRRRNELKMEVKIMLSDRNMKQLEQLEIIDNLQRLGLSYHFEDEIYSILNNLSDKGSKRDHLYAKALEFRLLRQHGFNIVSQGPLSYRLVFSLISILFLLLYPSKYLSV